jgi:hypothetical protein
LFTEKELKTTVNFIRKKKRAVLNNKKGSDLDYVRNLITLTRLENAIIVELEADKQKEGG